MSYVPSRPTHVLVIVDKQNKKARTVGGSVWVDAEGRASIKLGPGIRLDWRDEVYLNVYPVKTVHVRGGTNVRVEDSLEDEDDGVTDPPNGGP
jgi:hypothetical protein